ncbi:DUF4160 domain-containing protein [Candidatus Saccharibacteria bacterium]|nr:DUF4160 domain-containing protein [Candidatus Saccharibacteria bacterium]
MPVISMFYGMIIMMFYRDHNPPHFHVDYQGMRAIFDFNGNLVKGKIPSKQIKIVQAWCMIHYDELCANWKLASEGGTIYSIEPLK